MGWFVLAAGRMGAGAGSRRVARLVPEWAWGRVPHGSDRWLDDMACSLPPRMVALRWSCARSGLSDPLIRSGSARPKPCMDTRKMPRIIGRES